MTERSRPADTQAARIAQLGEEIAAGLERYVEGHVALVEAARQTLDAYQRFLDTDDLDVLRDALTALQDALDAAPA